MKDTVVIDMKEVAWMDPNELTALVHVATVSYKTSSELSPCWYRYGIGGTETSEFVTRECYCWVIDSIAFLRLPMQQRRFHFSKHEKVLTFTNREHTLTASLLFISSHFPNHTELETIGVVYTQFPNVLLRTIRLQ